MVSVRAPAAISRAPALKIRWPPSRHRPVRARDALGIATSSGFIPAPLIEATDDACCIASPPQHDAYAAASRVGAQPHRIAHVDLGNVRGRTVVAHRNIERLRPVATRVLPIGWHEWCGRRREGSGRRGRRDWLGGALLAGAAERAGTREEAALLLPWYPPVLTVVGALAYVACARPRWWRTPAAALRSISVAPDPSADR